MKKQFRLTQEGVDTLKAEVENLISRRPEIADAIKTARELGDLSENDEYRSARAEQDKQESRIAEIENILANAEIIKKPKGEGKVQLGSTVTLKGATKTKEFQIVGTVEADPLSGKISDESPIGRALLGKKIDESVEIVTPADTSTYKITAIN